MLVLQKALNYLVRFVASLAPKKTIEKNERGDI